MQRHREQAHSYMGLAVFSGQSLNHRHKKAVPGLLRSTSFFTASYLLTASVRPLATTSLITFLAAISMAAPVEGLRPVRAGRSVTFRLPIPGRVISPPFSS